MGLFYDICPDCGHKVSKRARFCSECGRGAPDGWTKCPLCGKWVGNDSHHCPHCNAPLHPSERVDLAGGVWDREAGLFAQRFELSDTRRVMKDGLMIQQGTTAVLLDGGKVVDTLSPGRHEPQGMLRKINWFGNPPPRSAVMVDSGDIVFRVDFTDSPAAQSDPKGGDAAVSHVPLRSAEELPVGAMAEVTLRFIPGLAVDFIANFMKERREITTKDVCAWLYEESVSAVRDLCLQSTIEDLVKDPERRERFEDALKRALQPALKRIGIELVRVGAVEFFGPEYEKVRAKYGDLDYQRRLVEFHRKNLELIAENEKIDQDDALQREERADQASMTREKRNHDYAEYVAQLAQEKDLSELDRANEIAIAQRVANGEIAAKDAELAAARALEEHAKELAALANSLELDLTQRNYERDQAIKDAENNAVLNAIKRREDELDTESRVRIAQKKVEEARAEADAKLEGVRAETEEASMWLDIKAKKNAIKNADLRERMEILGGRSLQDLAAVADDAQTRDAYLRHDLAKEGMAHDEKILGLHAGLTPQQIIAMQAGKSTAAADAYAREAEARENASKQVLDEIKKAMDDRHAHEEKVLEKLAEVAKAAVEHQSTTVVPPAPNIVH